jgi:hypothetical protein
MGMVYSATGEPGKALELYEQALPIRRSVGDRDGEAVTCFNMAMVSRDMGQARQAIEHLRCAVQLEQQVQHPDFSRDAALLAQWEAAAERGEALPGTSSSSNGNGLSSQQVQTIATNTLAVLTDMPEKRGEWRESIAEALEQARTANLQSEIELFTALLNLLDGETPSIPLENPYAKLVQTILQGVTPVGLVNLALPTDFAMRCVAGLKGSIQEKGELLDYLASLASGISNPGKRALIETVQKAVFGEDISKLGKDLTEIPEKAWQEIVRGIMNSA